MNLVKRNLLLLFLLLFVTSVDVHAGFWTELIFPKGDQTKEQRDKELEKKSLKELDAEKCKVEADIEGLKKTYKENEVALEKRYKTKFEELNKKEEEKVGEIKKLNDELEDLEKYHSKRKEEINTKENELGSRADALKREEEKLRKNEGKYKGDLSTYKDDKKELDDRNKKLSNDLKILNKNINEYNDDLVIYENKKTKLVEDKRIQEQKIIDTTNKFIERKKKLVKSIKKHLDKDCYREILKNVTFFYYDPLPISNWLINVNLSSFYDSRLKTLARNHQSFIDINSMDQFDFWIEPFFTHSDWNQKGKKCHLNALGFTVGGGISPVEDFGIGVGFGFYRSDIDCDKGKADFKSKKNDTLFLGPYLIWDFGSSCLKVMIWGGWNKYDKITRNGNYYDEDKAKIEIEEKNKKGLKEDFQEKNNSHDGWTLAARTEYGYTFEIGNNNENPGFIRPFVTLDFLRDFQDEYDELDEIDEKIVTILSVEKRHCDFLGIKGALEFKKEFHEHGKGYTIPRIALGWVYYYPICADTSSVSCFYLEKENGNQLDSKSVKHTESKKFEHEKYKPNSLVSVDAGLTYIFRNGISTSLNFEAKVGSVYQVYSGEIRLECGW